MSLWDFMGLKVAGYRKPLQTAQCERYSHQRMLRYILDSAAPASIRLSLHPPDPAELSTLPRPPRGIVGVHGAHYRVVRRAVF